VVADAEVEVLRPGTPVDDSNPANIMRSTTSDASGKFKLYFLTPGAYGLRAFPPTGLPQYQPVLEAVVTISPSIDADGNVLVLRQD
jgi:hypothetical protein